MDHMLEQSVWVFHDEKRCWKTGNVAAYLPDGSVGLIIDGEQYTAMEDEIFIKNTEDTSQIGDLINLIHLHEPAVLNAVAERYKKDIIYTQTGPILLSINPFKETGLYSDQIREQYNGLVDLKGSNPHLYRVAETALRGEGNQSILISGESGAGKTVATKIIMEYVAKCSSNDNKIITTVLNANPVLEAFGNAATIRNDNSSRFGKFIQLQMKGDQLIGAEIKNYLLEKVRVVKQNEGEKGFHIFYQLIANKDLNPKNFHYCTQDDQLFDPLRETMKYDDTVEAMSNVGFTDDQIQMIMNVVYAVLLLGNVKFEEVSGEDDNGNGENDNGVERVKITDYDLIVKICGLLQIEDVNLFIKGLVSKKIVAANTECEVNYSLEQAEHCCDAIAKFVYERLFQTIVDQINKRISFGSDGSDRFIGILDIFGFEIFEKNSFEQLCINYTNEKLQKLFNDHIFRLEQEEYAKEGVEWKEIEFPDNIASLALLDKLFVTVTEECLIPRGNDKNLASRVEKQFSNTDSLSISNAQRVDQRFSFTHYAGNVEYNCHTFVDKNKDILSESAYQLLNSSELEVDLSRGERVSRNNKLVTVMTAFKKQLGDLLTIIESSTPHYIRCMKPNDQNIADNFVEERVLQQLRYSGVLEAVKIARVGYPIRYIYDDLIKRYKMLMTAEDITELLSGFDLSEYQRGSSKLFMKRKLYDILESKRERRMASAATVIQTRVRTYLALKWYANVLRSVVKAQSVIRMAVATRKVDRMRKSRAATLIRKEWLRYRWSSWLKLGKLIIVLMQKRFRKRRKAAVLLQSMIRMMMCWARYRNYRDAVISLQCAWRKRVAVKVVKEMRREARDLNNVMEERDKYRTLWLEEKKRRERAEKEKDERVDKETQTDFAFVESLSAVENTSDANIIEDASNANIFEDINNNFEVESNEVGVEAVDLRFKVSIRKDKNTNTDLSVDQNSDSISDWELLQKSELLEVQIEEMKREIADYKRKEEEHNEVKRALGERMERILIERDSNQRQIILLKKLVRKLNK